MTITHHIKTAIFSWFLNCPMCGAEFDCFKEKRKLLSNNKLIESKKQIELRKKFIKMKSIKMSCSECSFDIEYKNEIPIEEINNIQVIENRNKRKKIQ